MAGRGVWINRPHSFVERGFPVRLRGRRNFVADTEPGRVALSYQVSDPLATPAFEDFPDERLRLAVFRAYPSALYCQTLFDPKSPSSSTSGAACSTSVSTPRSRTLVRKFVFGP